MSLPSESQDPVVTVRITNVDYAIEASGSMDNTSLPKVPVIRIFGLSSSGHKSCVHIHQVYPYIYVDYDGPMNPDAVNRYAHRLQRSLNAACALSLKRDPTHSRARYVRTIHVVKGVHFYGFHCAYNPFLKIYIVDPQHSLRIATILRSGGVMQRRFQVYESHLSFILQFMSDFGLYGCGELEISEAKVREQRIADVDREDPPPDIDTSKFLLSPYAKQSYLPIELDVAAYHIMNPRLLQARNIHNTLAIPAPPLPAEPLVLSVRELWEDERKRRLARGLPPTPVMPSDGTRERGLGPGWRAENRLRSELEHRVEKGREIGVEYSQDAASRSWERFIMTAFESREALWPSEYRKWKPEESEETPFQTPEDGEASAQVPSRSTSKDDVLDFDAAFLKSQKMQDLIFRGNDEPVNDDPDEEPLEVEEQEPESDQEDNKSGPPSPEKRRLANGEDRSSTPVKQRRTPAGPDRRSINRTPSRQSAFQEDLTPVKRQSPSLGHLEASKSSAKKRANPFGGQSWNGATDKISPTKRLSAAALVKRLSMIQAPVTTKFKPIAPLKVTHSERVQTLAAVHLPEFADALAFTPTLPATEVSASSGGVSNDPAWAPTILETDSESVPFSDASLLSEEVLPAPETVLSSDDGGSLKILASDNAAGDHPDQPPTKRPRLEDGSSRGLGFRFDDAWPPSSGSTGSIGPPHPSSAQAPILQDSRPKSQNAFTYPLRPPSTDDILSELHDLGLKEVLHRDPYYSNVAHIPKRPREYAGKLFFLKGGTGVGSLVEWKGYNDIAAAADEASPRKRRPEDDKVKRRLIGIGVTGWEYAGGSKPGPPRRAEVMRWLETSDAEVANSSRRKKAASQIVGPTQKNRYGFKVTQNKQTEASTRERQNMSILSIEVFAVSRGSLLPNPEFDRIESIFYAFQEEDVVITDPVERRASYQSGCIAISSAHVDDNRLAHDSAEIVETELDLLNRLVDRVREWDPDVLTGWELQNGSWGYVAERAWKIYSMSLSEEISRIISASARGGNTAYDNDHTSAFRCMGRHVLNTWRIMRVEQTLSSYTIENVAYHVLHRRIPFYSAETLTKWFKSDVPAHAAKAFRHFRDRSAIVLEILDETQVVTKNAEFARVFGVEFFSVLSRGSQFKVESFMARIAKPESFMLPSPSREDVGKQNAAECVPLIMEPKSAYYKSPLVVLDFQSLYPSIMIAYNYCYSTCLGRVGTFKGKNKFGVLEDLKLPEGLLDKLKDNIIIAPNGIMYVNPTVRKSLLAKMLTELLETRVMVKQAMKTCKDDKALLRVLDARQLSLKFICNVTYGYTSASFSGRMPAVEIADSIVQSGRETLEKAITTINTTSKWGAKVVYGDTDSLFVSLEGKTKEQAFRIGNEMAEAITSMNPRPVKLKFEKVYFPCVLLAKKRYVGFKYENPDDVEPVFDAKGIETVRRDGIPAGQKMLENCLKILFRSQDLSEVKSYCQSSWTKLMDGRVSLQDFIFSKEVRMGHYSDKGPPPPGVVVAARRVTRDPRAEAQYGDRIPYVITRGEPKSRLVDRAFEPLEVLKDRHQYQLDAAYYIEHQLIPPLERVFNLVGANVASWYNEMPKVARPTMPESLVPKTVEVGGPAKAKFTIEEHFKSKACVVCGRNSTQVICPGCKTSPRDAVFALESMRRGVERRVATVQEICASCSAVHPAEEIECESLDCSWLFERHKAQREARALEGVPIVLEELERELKW